MQTTWAPSRAAFTAISAGQASGAVSMAVILDQEKPPTARERARIEWGMTRR